jgi:hypothetical protein
MPFAFDRALGSRCRIDSDGRLHARSVPISRVGVSTYEGREVPGWKVLGLDAGRDYRLLRDADELAKSATTWAGVPILSRHIAVGAPHDPRLVVGAVGTDAHFDGEFVRASLAIWAASAIRGIEDGTKAQLSCGYRYGPGPRIVAGRFRGQAFDGRMLDLVGHHVALVARGRCGADCAVVLNSREDIDERRFAAA